MCSVNFPSLSFFEKVWPTFSKLSGKVIKNKLLFHQICQEFGIELHEDDFDFVYLQSLAIFLQEEQHDWGSIFELPDVRRAFHGDYSKNNFDETNRLLDHHLHVTIKMGPLKDINCVPENILSDFSRIFQELTTQSAKPSVMHTSRIVTESKDELLTSQTEIKQGVSELQGDLNTMKQLLEQFVTVGGEGNIANNSGYQHIVDDEHQAQLDYIKKLIDQKSISAAQALLLDLKERILTKGSNAVKARLLNNIGLTFILQDKQDEAIAYYEYALQYSDTDAPPLVNLVGLYFARRCYERAIPLVEKLKDSHPGLQTALNIYLESEKEISIEPDSMLPETQKTNPEALVALVNVYIKRAPRKALEYAKKLYLSDQNNDNYIEIYCNIALIALVGERVDFHAVELQNDDDRKILIEARSLISTLWDKIRQTDYKSFRMSLLERFIVLMTVLKENDEAIRLAEEALSYNQQSYNAKKLLGMNLLYIKRFDEAAKVFDEIAPEHDQVWEYLPAWMISRARAGGIIEVEKMAAEHLARIDSKEEDHLRIYLVLAALLTEQKQYDKALNTIENALGIEPNNIAFLADKALILRGLNQTENVIQCDAKIVELAKGDLSGTDIKDIYIAANYLAENGNYAVAADLMSLFVNTGNNNSLTLQLADYLARSGRKGRALLIYENLRQAYGVSKGYTRHEVEIYHFYKDYPRAVEVLEQYNKKYPEDFQSWLNLGGLYIKVNNQKALTKFCKVDTSARDFTFNELQSYISILHLQGHRKRCLDLVYNYRRKHPGLQANHLYISYCLEDPTNRKETDEIKSVKKNAAVFLTIGYAQYNYVIEDIPEEQLNKTAGEINLQNKIYKRLQGKQVGAKVTIENQLGIQQELEITSIIPKYRFAFQQAMHQNTTIYALESGYVGGNINTIEDLEKLVDGQIKKRETIHELLIQSEFNYKRCLLPLPVFARLTHKNPIEIYDYFASRHKGIRYSIGDVKQYTSALQIAESNNTLVFDITALLTLYRIGLIIKMPDAYKLIIAPATKELIDNYVREKLIDSHNDSIAVFEHNGETVRMFVTAEDKLVELTRLQGFQAWVNDRVEIIPCKLLLDHDDDQANKFKELFGADVLESVLLAKEVDGVLVSDDAANRRLVGELYNIKTIWTQPLLKSLSTAGIMREGDYNNFIYKLIKLGHQHTTVNSNEILLAMERSDYQIKDSFEALCELLSGKYSDDQSINIAFSVISGVFQKDLPIRRKEDLIYFVLLNFIGYRCLRPLLNQLSLHSPLSVRNISDLRTLQQVIATLIEDIGLRSTF